MFEEVEFCGYMEFINEKWGVFLMDWFKEYEDVEFEGYKFRVIKDRKKFLILRYNNYMEFLLEDE